MLTNYVRTLRRFNRNVRLYLLATGLLGFGFDGGVYTVLFNLYLLRLGFGPEYIGQVNSAGLLAFALSSLPAGALGSRFGNRRIMVMGLLLIMAGGLGLPVAEQLPGPSVGAGLLIAYVTSYLGLALYFANSVPFAMDITTPEERNHAFSMQTALLALAAFCGALVGGLLPRLVATIMGIDLQQPAPYRLPLVSAATLIALALWAILRTRVQAQELDASESVSAGSAPSDPLHSERTAEAGLVRLGGWETAVATLLVLLSLVRFFQVAGVGSASTFFNVYLDTALRAPTAQIGALAALARLTAVPAALFTPVLVARWGAPRTVVWASAVTTLSLLPLALAPHWIAAGLGLMGVTAFSSMRYPAYLVYSMTLVPPRWRSTLNGAGETAGGLSFALIALVGGYLIEAQGFTALFLLSAALTTVGTVLFYLWFVAPRAKRQPAPAG